MKRLGIIGHFGGGKTFLDGQTIKTKIFYEEMTKRGYENIFCVDTYYNRINKVRLMWDTLRCLLVCDTIVIVLSRNGLKIYLPLMYFAKKFLGKRIYHHVVGGSLAEYAKENPKSVKYLASFDANWVQAAKMVEDLSAMGITNCEVVTNFKKLNSKNALEKVSEEGGNKFCMFSRVMKDKGMTEAILAVAEYNTIHDEKIKLDIWGPVEANYKEEFESLCAIHGEYVSYMGSADYDKSVEAITDNVALLFPTRWSGEGFPGTVVDAYAAAVPVIASDWNANKEVVRDFETGWVYPNDKVSNLLESIEWAMAHPDEMHAMRKNCLLLSTRYTPDYVMRRLVEKYFKD